ncbi:hypothetical protein PRUPE_2G183300 [Prunus persica]|uniref:Uncharacterized protein n=1 Tax=Prunus persica TaxID=3760 RepID=M5X5J6_PRUPE|nr:uncharacterized protein LOC18785861 [Prunus persica]ONI23345.1 hypothetical protein PRUPE_2G183300 [Prunus persica]
MSLFEGVKNDLQFSHQDSMGFHGWLNNETRENSRSCKFCSEPAGYCDFAEAPFEERKRLVDIRNSVKEVENMFMVLQRMGSWQQMDRHAAFTNLEESRVSLSAKVAEHKGRALDVVTELKACFGNENNVPFNWDFKETLKEKAEPAAHSRRFLTDCIRKLFISRKWQRVGFAVKLVMVSASIFSLMAAYHIRQLLYNSARKRIPFVASKDAGKIASLLTISKSPLDVFCGRG